MIVHNRDQAETANFLFYCLIDTLHRMKQWVVTAYKVNCQSQVFGSVRRSIHLALWLDASPLTVVLAPHISS
jgi:hypothetical protein